MSFRHVTTPLAQWAIVVAGPILVTWISLYPELRHFWVPHEHLPRRVVAQIARTDRQALLTELSRNDLGPVASLSDAELMRAATGLSNGRLELPGLPPAEVDPEFSREDLRHPSSIVQLNVASLAVPDIYLRAAKLTGDGAYHGRAAAYLHHWWNHERRSLLPTGLQWNDHAVAARVFVLTRYWLAAGASEAELSREGWVLDALRSSAARLLKPDYFTLRTNHGLMQSLALMHIAACFPQLPESREYAEVARARLEQQLQWYLSPEGIVLEHSAGYHIFGVDLLTKAVRYLSVLGMDAPAELVKRLVQAERFSAELRRPDGSLPALGDTVRNAKIGEMSSYVAVPTVRGDHAPDAQGLLAPISGYAIWWQMGQAPDSSLAHQLVVTWSHFATEAHRHSDDLSLLLWSKGHDWIIASGYWPYDSPARAAATSWMGANGPHSVNEPPGAAQSSAPLGYAASSRFAALDLRRTDGQLEFRRQIVQLGEAIWLVLDSTRGSSVSPVETVWTLDPQIVAAPRRQPSPSGFRLTHADGATGALTFMSGSPSLQVSATRGTRLEQPLGWTAVDGLVVATTSIVTRIAVGASVGTLIDLGPVSAELTDTSIEWSSPAEWRVHYGYRAKRYDVRRHGSRISVGETGRARAQELELSAGALEVGPQRAAIDASYLSAAQITVRYNESHLPYRIRAAVGSGVLGLMSVIAFAVVVWLQQRSRFGARMVWGACVTIAMCWTILAAWLLLVYFD